MLELGKNTHRLFKNNPRSSILPLSAPDPNFFSISRICLSAFHQRGQRKVVKMNVCKERKVEKMNVWKEKEGGKDVHMSGRKGRK